MSKQPSFHLILGVIVSILMSCQQPTWFPQTKVPSMTYFISPDTLCGSVCTPYLFAMRASDSNWRAYKYLWDFEDGTPPCSTRSNQSFHTFFSPGEYRVFGKAVDSLGAILATINSVATISLPTASVTISPHGLTTSSDSGILFHAHLAVTLPLTYVWEFGDGSAATTGSTIDTITHGYSEDGTYRVIVAGYYNNTLVGSDTSTVTVKLATTSYTNLCTMFTVTSVYSSEGRDYYSITLPLINAGDNSFSISGNSFIASLLHQSHIVHGNEIFDTVKERSIRGALSQSGRYLIRTFSSILDSAYFVQAQRPNDASGYLSTWESTSVNYLADSLTLSTLTPDSIVFRSRCYYPPQIARHQMHVVYDNTCGTYLPDVSISPGFPTTPGAVRVIFRREH